MSMIYALTRASRDSKCSFHMLFVVKPMDANINGSLHDSQLFSIVMHSRKPPFNNPTILYIFNLLHYCKTINVSVP